MHFLVNSPGIRVPDDESDRITWRNGRVINNVFVPNEQRVRSGEARMGKQARQLGLDLQALETSDTPHQVSYQAGPSEHGSPVYYVVEEPDSLHSDRSPYNFEPADTQPG